MANILTHWASLRAFSGAGRGCAENGGRLLVFAGRPRRNWATQPFCTAGWGCGGHNWPFWNKFRGGKGVAVSCTWLILYPLITGALCCLAGGGAVLLSGYLPLGPC